MSEDLGIQRYDIIGGTTEEREDGDLVYYDDHLERLQVHLEELDRQHRAETAMIVERLQKEKRRLREQVADLKRDLRESNEIRDELAQQLSGAGL